MRHETNHIQFLNAVLVFKEFLDHFGDFLVSVEALGVAVAGRVHNGQRIRNAESFRMMDVVDGYVACLAVNLRSAGRLFLNQLETEGILPLNVENMVNHSIDERRLAETSCAHHQNRFVLHSTIPSVSFSKSETFDC